MQTNQLGYANIIARHHVVVRNLAILVENNIVSKPILTSDRGEPATYLVPIVELPILLVSLVSKSPDVGAPWPRAPCRIIRRLRLAGLRRFGL